MFEDMADPEVYKSIQDAIVQLKSGHRKFYLFNLFNALVVPKSLSVNRAYQNRIEGQLFTGLLKVDPANHPIDDVNNYLAIKSYGQLKNFITHDMVPDFENLLFMDIVNFEGAWMHPFDVRETRKASFTNNKGVTKQVDMMSQVGPHFYYANVNRIQSLGIPYADDKLILFIILPPENRSIKQFEKELNSQTLTKLISTNTKKNMKVMVPKLEIKQTVDLKSALKFMGISQMFNDEANFSLINSQKSLHVSNIIHGAFFHINEKGNKMLSSRKISGKNAYGDHEFIANRPFFFAVVDKPSQMITLFGKVLDINP